MWTIRLVLLSVLVVLTGIDFFMLRHRREHERLIENGVLNLIGVVLYNACCYLVAALPPAGGWDHRPLAFFYPSIRIGFPVLGAVLIFGGILLFGISLCQRRVLGLQDVPSGLLTGGIYRHFRHPVVSPDDWSFRSGLVDAHGRCQRSVRPRVGWPGARLCDQSKTFAARISSVGIAGFAAGAI